MRMDGLQALWLSFWVGFKKWEASHDEFSENQNLIMR
jgi:hypothetical protein